MELAKDFSVSKVFSDNMVLQRDCPVKVWGFAPESENGRTVTASILGVSGSAAIENGHFCITLDSYLPLCSEGTVLSVRGDGKEIRFENVLVGDVFYVIGQSNIRFPLEAITEGAPEGYPGKDCIITNSEKIRLNRSSIHDGDDENASKYPVRGTTELCEDVRHGRSWEMPEEGALQFSALGYFVARNIIAATNNQIPVGLIEMDADGQSLNDFMPNELADALHTDRLEDGVYKGMFHIDYQPTRFVYNQFMYPYQNCSFKGIIWYQGESDFNDVNRPLFAKNYTVFMTELRRRFTGMSEIPVFMVEIPSCYTQYDGFDGELWAYIDMAAIRCEMGKVPNLLDDCYLSASSDLFLDDHFWNSLHPLCKYQQAERVSSMLLARLYGIGEMESAAGPQYTRVEYNGESATVYYRYIADGLTCAQTSDLLGFEVKTDGVWKAPESASVCDNSVHLTAGGRITGVRYNAQTPNFFPKHVNLCSSEGIPAIAFIDEM